MQEQNYKQLLSAHVEQTSSLVIHDIKRRNRKHLDKRLPRYSAPLPQVPGRFEYEYFGQRRL